MSIDLADRCPVCGGNGYYIRRERTPDGRYKESNEDCGACKGSGRAPVVGVQT
jgi:DnaJ-class molecular chaperone